MEKKRGFGKGFEGWTANQKRVSKAMEPLLEEKNDLTDPNSNKNEHYLSIKADTSFNMDLGVNVVDVEHLCDPKMGEMSHPIFCSTHIQTYPISTQ